MIGHPTTIVGFPLPSDAPLFLAFVAVHVAAGLIAVIAGAIAMLSRKRPGRHPRAGTVYYWALAVVFVTMSALAFSRWREDYHLFILGLLSFVAATVGRTARRKLWPSWPRIHMTGMGASYILMITAFYVDNGPNLPLWRELPPLAFWTLPTLIGAPILINALLRHPLARQMDRRNLSRRFPRSIIPPGRRLAVGKPTLRTLSSSRPRDCRRTRKQMLEMSEGLAPTKQIHRSVQPSDFAFKACRLR